MAKSREIITAEQTSHHLKTALQAYSTSMKQLADRMSHKRLTHITEKVRALVTTDSPDHG